MRTEIVLRGEPMSFPEIGRRLGGRDHTSALHGFRMHEKRLREAQQS
jgi:chromosomal replication initiation ATPase DnaA